MSGSSLRRITLSHNSHPADSTPPDGKLVAYQFEGLLNFPETTHAVFTRHGGMSRGSFTSLNLSRAVGDDPSAVAENNRRTLAALGYRREQAVTAWLLHSRDVAVITQADRGRDPQRVDALVTRERGLPLTMRFADCAPIVLYDPVQQAIGVAHAGWRGVALNVVEATVRTMADAFGSDPRQMWVGIGPAIGVEHYEVGPDVAEQVAAACPAGTPLVRPGDRGRPHLDLGAAVEAQLKAAGIGAIEASGICTASNTHEWFSHRAEKGETGRFGLVVALR
ncbi:MAG TPA: peptidoglycan editing factor PgeF [Anaerolineae bacterium]